MILSTNIFIILVILVKYLILLRHIVVGGASGDGAIGGGGGVGGDGIENVTFNNNNYTKMVVNISNDILLNHKQEQQQQQHQQHHNGQQPNLLPMADDPTIDLTKPISSSSSAFPKRPDAVYFIVAVTGGAKMWGRTLTRTLLDMGAPFSSLRGPPLRPLYVNIPQNGKFSVKVLLALCNVSDEQKLAGVIVFGEGDSARAVALAGSSMGLPVLWAKGGTATLGGINREIPTPLQVILQPSSREMLESIRALFLQTHWYSFFVLSDVEATMEIGGNEGEPLRALPLTPKILPLSANNNDIFRQLAKISRSTRGVILLLCDLEAAHKVMIEAHHLNMVGGHFIWVWADTRSTTDFFDSYTAYDNGGIPLNSDEIENTNIETNIVNVAGVVSSPSSSSSSSSTLGASAIRVNNQNYHHHSIKSYLKENNNNNNSDSSTVKHHYTNLLHRKIDFEDLNVQKPLKKPSKLEKNINDKNKSQFPERYIIGLNKNIHDSDELINHNGENGDLTSSSSSSSLKDSKENDRLFISNLNGYNDQHILDYSSFDNNKNDEGGRGGGGGGGGGDMLSSFNTNDPNNDDADDDDEQTSQTKFRRQFLTNEPFTNMSNAQHILFNNFKGFPIGFLALRPIRMNVDRHFIRSAVRLFATTWAEIELMARQNTLNEMNYRDRKKLFRIRRQSLLLLLKSKEQSKLNIDKIDDSKQNVNNTFLNSSDLHTNNYNNNNNNNKMNSERNHDQNSNGQILSGLNINNNLNNLNNNNNINTNNNNTNDNNNNINNTNNNNNINNNNNNNKNSNITKPSTISFVPSSSLLSISSFLSLSSSASSSNSHTHSNESDEILLKNRQLKKRQNDWLPFEQRTEFRYSKGAPNYSGGCYGQPDLQNIWNAENFASKLKGNMQLALSGQKFYYARENVLTTQFELLNLVPNNRHKPNEPQSSLYNEQQYLGAHLRPTEQLISDNNNNEPIEMKWRRVGLVSGQDVHLDTIVWPGGDIIVSGLSAKARSVFRIVTALAPPFVMESELDEDGMCLRGLQCHRLAKTGNHNLTLMFNAIETRGRLEEDAVEHGDGPPPPPPAHVDEKVAHITKCCYGLSMDILENIATELGFQFHLYIVRDELFGAKYYNFKKSGFYTTGQTTSSGSSSSSTSSSIPENAFKSNVGNVGGKIDKKNYIQLSQREQQFLLQQSHEAQQIISAHKQKRKLGFNEYEWNGIMGDLVSGAADMSFAPLSVSKSRAEVIDFTTPYFHSGVSLLAAPKTKSEIPLLAFLLPFSPELWIAIFTSLNITAVAVAVYEWLSPFGLNPWGRQRSKNFSISSALWVMWGLLCGHLVAFKAPKSWPNKFLINVWGGFSVIFVASYTANIAALIAGLFFHNAANNYDASLYTHRVGAPRSTAAEYYVQNTDQRLWEHMRKYSLSHIEEGIQRLKNGSIDLLMADSPILDYYRATDHGCSLQRIGETFVDDAYAIGMAKGFPLRDSISALIAKYSTNGYLDILQEKWYGGLPCFKFEADVVQPRPLGVAAVAGVFLLLGMGMLMGVIILIFEHWFYKYALPSLRLKPKGTVWKSRNIMFFSQKLYRFINCVELVSPHHAARELVHSIRQGQIASLFQKSIKRKEDEQRRRRKSKAQFFEMIQEIRRVQQNEREATPTAQSGTISTRETTSLSCPSISKEKISPRSKIFATIRWDGRTRSNSSALSIRRFSTDSIFGEHLNTVGRRLSRDISFSPPPSDDGHQFETFGKSISATGSYNKFDTFDGSLKSTTENLEKTKFDTFSNYSKINPPYTDLPIKNNKQYRQKKRPALTFDTTQHHHQRHHHSPRFKGDSIIANTDEYELPVVKEGLEPPIYQDDRSKAVLKDKLHRELRAKYGPHIKEINDNLDDDDDVSNCSPPVKIKTKKLKNERLDKYKLGRHQQQQQQQIDSGKLLSNHSSKQIGQNKSLNESLKTPIVGILKTSPSSTINRKQILDSTTKTKMNFQRLSREDLLRLSHSSQSEIHEYLSNAHDERPAEPP